MDDAQVPFRLKDFVDLVPIPDADLSAIQLLEGSFSNNPLQSIEETYRLTIDTKWSFDRVELWFSARRKAFIEVESIENLAHCLHTQLIQQAAKNGQALRAKWNTLNPQSQHNFLVQVKKRWEEIFLKSALPQHFTQAFRSLEKQVKPQDSKPTSMGMSIVSFIAPDLDIPLLKTSLWDLFDILTGVDSKRQMELFQKFISTYLEGFYEIATPATQAGRTRMLIGMRKLLLCSFMGSVCLTLSKANTQRQTLSEVYFLKPISLDFDTSPLDRIADDTTGFLEKVKMSGLPPHQILQWACYEGYVELVAQLLPIVPNHMRCTTSSGHSLLHLACVSGNPKLVKLLVEKGYDPSIKDLNGKDPIQYILDDSGRALIPNAIAIAQELAAERNVVEELAGKYLIQAVFSGDINVIETLLKRGYNKNEAAGGHSAIVWASMVGNKDVIDTLLRYGADSTGLLASLAAQSDSKLLANYMHLDLDSPDSHGYYPIHRAILCDTPTDNFDNAKLLVSKGCDVDKLSPLGTPLHVAATTPSRAKFVSLLLDYGANPHIPDSRKQLPIDVAANNEITRILLVATQQFHKSHENLKALGNKAFGAKDYRAAAVMYSRALQHPLNNTQRAILLSNRSACFAKLGQTEKALEDAKCAVELDRAYVKGHYRLAMAYKLLGKKDSAIAALQEALQLEPSNATLQDELRSLR